MPRILGVHAKVSGGAYSVGFVIVENRAVVLQVVVPAPGESEARQLSELYTRAVEVMGNANSDLIALRLNEAPGSRALIAHRAEGVVIAAAGGLNLRVRPVTGRSMWSPAGLQSTATNAESVNALCQLLGGQAVTAPECHQAAAAAMVAELRPL